MILIQFVLLYIIYIRFYMFFYIIVFKQKFIHPYLYIFYMWLCSRIFLFFLLNLWKYTCPFSCLFWFTFIRWRITFFFTWVQIKVLGLEMLTLFAFEKENGLFDSTDQIYLFLFLKLITFSWAKFQWWSSKTIKTEIIANQRRWVNKAYNVKIPIWGKIRYYKIKILTNLIFKKRM